MIIKTDKKVSGVIVTKCNCKHEFQDKQYGKGKRAMNIKRSGDTATCTVCKEEQRI